MLADCRDYFIRLWNERVNAEPGGDLISMLAHGPQTRDCTMDEYFSNVTLLIIGGNDTTRNTISGSIFALNRFPEQYDRLRADPSLIPSMVVRDDPLADAAGPHGARRRPRTSSSVARPSGKATGW